MKGNRGGGRHPNGHPWRRMGTVSKPGGASVRKRMSRAEIERVVAFLQNRPPSK